LRMKPSPWVSLRMVNPMTIVVLRQSRRYVMEKVEHQKLVGPVIRGIDQEIIEALLIAIADDNPDAELFYEDHGGYVRIHTPWRCRVTRKSMEAALGRSFRLSELEPSLSAFAGRMRSVGDEELEWYLERED
jgi:toluene monooxygenase system protein D